MTTVQNDSISGYCVAFEPTVGVGALGANVPQTFVRADTWMNLDNNIRSKQDCNSFPIINVAAHVPQNGNINSNWYVNETGRGEVHPANVEQLNLKGNNVWNNLSFVDKQKTTTKETTEFAYAGNAAREDKGTEFWTYKDAPKTTTRETTEFAYAGNAAREDKGTEFWTYKDAPKTTTRETTEFAYAGNVVRENAAMMSYNQFTGYDLPEPSQKEEFSNQNGNQNGFKKKAKFRSGGADTYALRGATLVENWISPAGRQNLRQDASGIIGKINFGTFGCDQNHNGPGTIQQALPDGERFQNTHIIGKQHPSPNRLMAVDDRQLAGYQVDQLQQNPLSIFTVNPNSKTPEFFKFIQPDSYSTMVQKNDNELVQPKPVYEGMESIVANNTPPVYPNKSGTKKNPNAGLVYNQNINGTEQVNNFVVQKHKLNSRPKFSGKAYSGDDAFFWNNNGTSTHTDSQTITMGGKDEPVVYGDLYKSVNVPSGMAQGIQNKRLQSQQSQLHNPNVCEGNPQLKFATNTLVLESVGGN